MSRPLTNTRARIRTAIDGGVGAARRHDSGPKHVSGEALYIDDIPEPPGLLHIHIAQSRKAHAAITRMDLTRVRTAPGVVAVIAAADIPGPNDVSPIAGDDPMFAEGLVEYWGQSLFAVAAESREAAWRAAQLAEIAYEELSLIHI